MSVQPRKDIFAGFKAALNGLVYTFKTQRHMRFHLYVVLVVMVLGVFFNLRLRELLVLLFTISLVLVAEMFNSAIEATVDRIGFERHKLAGLAKDIGSAAVLMSFVLLTAVWLLVLLGR